MSERAKDILNRAIKTFWQAAIAYLLADVTVLQAVLTDMGRSRQLLLSLAIGAVAAGLSAAYNGIISPLFDTKDSIDEGTD